MIATIIYFLSMFFVGWTTGGACAQAWGDGKYFASVSRLILGGIAAFACWSFWKSGELAALVNGVLN